MPALGLPAYPFREPAHDRMSEHRKDTAFLASAWRDPATRVVVMQGDELVLADGADGGLARFSTATAPTGERMLLGSAAGVVTFLVLHEPAEPTDSAAPLAELRALASALPEVDLSLAVHAVALARWHRRHPRCSVCGASTDVVEAGASRLCPACGAQHFPRTDPAVIMLVRDADDRCLLGHNAARPATSYSTLAGFVEPGESLEAAVRREVFEETGVEVGDVEYRGSQPWPFPSSLMLGFFAQATSTTIRVDGAEITDARWFSRDELRDALESGAVVVPTTVSISGALLTAWYGAELPSAR